MSPLVATFNQLLALGTIGLQVGALILLILHFTKQEDTLKRFLRENALLLTFILSCGGMILTLVYSEVFGFVPCGLCWFERIFLYPVVLITGIALWKGDKNVNDYILGLSVVGALIALYHHYIQMGGSEFIACPSSGGDCAKRIIFEFGYITFPLMAFSLFVVLALLMLFARKTPTQA